VFLVCCVLLCYYCHRAETYLQLNKYIYCGVLNEIPPSRLKLCSPLLSSHLVIMSDDGNGAQIHVSSTHALTTRCLTKHRQSQLQLEPLQSRPVAMCQRPPEVQQDVAPGYEDIRRIWVRGAQQKPVPSYPLFEAALLAPYPTALRTHQQLVP
jgi:hypothetical protein